MLRYDFYGADIYNDRRIVSKGGKFGFINKVGEEVIPCKYDCVHGFYYGNSMVVIGNKVGVIDVNGNVIVPLKYSYMLQITTDLFIVEVNKKCTVIDSKDNNLINNVFYDNISSDFFGNLVIQEGNKYGVMNRRGKLLLPVMYDKIEKNKELWKVTLNEKKGLVDNKNKTIIEAIYDSIDPICHDIFKVCVNNLVGLVSFEGKTLIEPIYASIESITEDIFLVKDVGEKYGVIDRTGKEIIPIKYEEICEYFNVYKDFQTYIVKLNGKYGLLDNDSNIIFDIIYDDVDYYFGPNIDVLKFKQGEVFGLISVTGEIIVEPKYNDILHFDSISETAIVQIGKKKGCINGSGKEIIPVEFDNIQVLFDNFIKVKRNKKYGLYSCNGDKIAETIYDDINVHDCSRGIISVTLKGLNGYLELQ